LRGIPFRAKSVKAAEKTAKLAETIPAFGSRQPVASAPFFPSGVRGLLSHNQACIFKGTHLHENGCGKELFFLNVFGNRRYS